MKYNVLRFISSTFYFAALVCTSFAQKPPTPEQKWTSRPVIQLWPGKAPGSESDDRKEQLTAAPGNPGFHIVRNIVSPTLTVFQPKNGNTTHSAVLIVPGGGFRVLAIEEEGYPVADWFSQHGVTAYVLKYRLAPTPAGDEDFEGKNLSPANRMKLMTAPLPKESVALAVADGLQALKLVRKDAAKNGYDADKIIAVGFSAGGAVVIGTMGAETATDRPNYAGIIYSGLIPGTGLDVPKNGPPAFMAVAEDDKLVLPAALNFFDALREQGASPELHVYRSGQHGFSMKERGTSDHWLQEFWWWLGTFHLTGQ